MILVTYSANMGGEQISSELSLSYFYWELLLKRNWAGWFNLFSAIIFPIDCNRFSKGLQISESKF